MSERRHSAIMFTDIVGYTALMGSDEDHAFEVLKKNREIHTRLIEQFNGTLIKEMGDGMLISFDLASEAVRCAVEIQKAAKSHDIPLKIGIHEGEMVFDGNDVLGDGVNIASRLEAGTQSGCISISGSVYHNIKNKPDIKAEFLEEKKFKNVSESIRVYQVMCGNDIPGKIRSNPSFLKSQEKKSILVLPFKNISSDPDQEYFCEGISEDIINALTYIENIKVISRASSFSFKNMEIDDLQIGRKLGVEFILVGSLRKEKNRLRVSVKLISVNDGSVLHSQRFDRDLKNLFDIQDDITGALINKLKVKLSAGKKEIRFKPTYDNLEVYNLYLLARYHVYKFSEDNLKMAMAYVDKLRKIDPEFGPAYIITGGIYALLGGSGVTVMPPKIAIPKSMEAYLRGITLDPNLAEAHAHLSYLYAGYYWNIQHAKKHIEKALRLNPNQVEVRRNHAWYCSFSGNFKEAIQEITKAIEIDPCFPLIYQNASLHYYFDKQYDKTIEFGYKALEIDPNLEFAYWNMGMAYIKKGMLQKAIEALENAPSINHLVDGFLGYAYTQLGDDDQAQKLIAGWEDRMNQGLASASGLALIYFGLGKTEQVFKWLEAAVQEIPASSVYTSLIHIDPIWDPLREEPRFKMIMNKMSF